ncbi:MAG: hypothetical protein ACC628_19965 [Pirellulaceae bacterium]
MTAEIRHAFEAIGAEMVVETVGNVFEIDVRQNGDRELYRLKYPLADTIRAEVLDVKPKQRHLVLDVSGWRLPINGRYSVVWHGTPTMSVVACCTALTISVVEPCTRLTIWVALVSEQRVEHQAANLEVTGSTPVPTTTTVGW